MNQKYIKKNALILMNGRIDSAESFLAKFAATQPGADPATALKQKCKEAELVDLTGNTLTNDAFSEIFASFPFEQVNELYLGVNEFTKIPEGVKKMPNLQALGAIKNKIEDASAVEFIPGLKRLELKSNNIQTMKTLEKMSKTVEYVSLPYNQITSLNDCPDLPNLIHLGLFGNNIGYKDDAAKNNEALLETVHVLRTKCPKLEELYIEGNEICTTPAHEETFKSGLKTLKVLNGKIITLIP